MGFTTLPQSSEQFAKRSRIPSCGHRRARLHPRACWTIERQYATSIASPDSGRLEGPWRHEPEPILQDDRGHGTVFTDFDGRLLFVVHRYFKQPATRVQIWELEERHDRIVVKGQILGSP